MPDIKETLIDLLTGYSLDTYEDVQYVADELLAKDVVPVVRCKDCALQYGCKVAQLLGNDGFCSYGERKEGDGNG